MMPEVQHGWIAMNDAGGSRMVRQQRMMPAASDNGSQPYSYPPGGCEMAGTRLPRRIQPAFRQATWFDIVPYLKARLKMGCRFYQPFRRTHRHGCMAGYHCLMPTALLSLRPHTQSIYISTLRPMTNLSTFPIAKYTIYQYFPLQFIPNLSAFPFASNIKSICIPHCN